MILDLHREGLSVSAIARQLELDRKTVRKYIERGLEPPAYGPRKPRSRQLEPFEPYLRQRVAAYPGLTGSRLLREIREGGYRGGYTAVTDFLRDVRPAPSLPFEVRFETPPGHQGQVDFAHFQVVVTGEDDQGHIVYNRALVDFARHHGFHPRACRPYRAKTKGKVERPFRYIREDFFLARSFRNLDDLNRQLAHWLSTAANPRLHATTQRVVNEAFAEEKPLLNPLPLVPFNAVLKLERRVSHEGMVSVGGNLYSVPDATRRRVVEVHTLADEIRIFEDGRLIAAHAVLEGRHQRRVAPGHRKMPSIPCNAASQEPGLLGRAGDVVARRSLDFYEAVARRLAADGGRP